MAITFQRARTRYAKQMPMLKKLFWAYFLLLIFEGALRKWALPQLSAPLLLVRDPIALLIIFEAYREGKWPEKWSTITGILAVLLLGICVVQLVAGDNPWFAALYGLRSYLLPFPVAFIMGENLTEEDLNQFAKATLWILLPMTLLEIAQYTAPPGSFLNKGAYEGAEQIMYVEQRVRASGTFSFVTGPTGFTPLAAAFILYGFVNGKVAPKWLVWTSAFALLLSIPIIGSRTLVFELVAVMICAGIGALCGVAQLFQALKYAAPLLIVSFLVSLLPVFSEASVSLHTRFSQASSSEGSISHAVQERTIGSIQDTIEAADFFSHPFGLGMGAGAAAITKLMQGEVEYIAGEGEFGRVMYEIGPFPGLFFMVFRLLLAAFVTVCAVAAARRHQPLALLLVPLTYNAIFFSILEQPTEQGFMVIGLAFSLGALGLSRVQPVQGNVPSFRLPRTRLESRPR